MLVCIYSSDVSIILQKPEQTSIRNILRGKITQIEIQDSRVDLAVLVEGNKIWASISKWAQNELRFAVGQDVYVQIKAVSVM
ncbi:TPA: TOBE domain-containing protein [Streptococcus pyogenes]|nr:TOBE domain-containing protein [Streptococcus pyogenes]